LPNSRQADSSAQDGTGLLRGLRDRRRLRERRVVQDGAGIPAGLRDRRQLRERRAVRDDAAMPGGLRIWTRSSRAGLILLALLLVPVLWQDMPVVGAMRLGWLDVYQALAPRARRSAPVVIVAIDEASLAHFGQWPWPRNLVAELINGIRAAGPASIGVDLLLPEADRTSPELLATAIAGVNPALARRLESLPHHDAVLAASIKAAPVALGIAGVESGTPAATAALAPSLQKGGEAAPFLRHFASALRSLPEIDAAARGHGLLSADTEGGVMRRVPMVAMIGATPVLPLSLEMLRVASGEPLFAVYSDKTGVRAVGIGDLIVPTQPDGRLWVHYTPHDESRFVSAAEVLMGRADGAELESKLVLVGVTGLGLIDYQTTPLGERMPGIEIHAQVLENVFDGSLLSRPRWAPWLEAAALLVLGVLLVYSVPRLAPLKSGVLLALLLGALAAAGFALYKGADLLIDASVPGAALALLVAAMLAATLAEANAQRKLLREVAARIAGELDAARRIQIGILPRPESAFPGERRFELFALMESAREVGGDLYDFFMLDADRLFFLIGDVSGKGLPASIFMAVSKALCKNAILRRGERVDEMLREASTEIARENPESLFVTAFAGVLDARTGLVQYCSAGHDAPFLLVSGSGEIVRLEAGGGPPLCVIEGYAYAAAEHRLRRGDLICLFTDGVTEAINAAGELYGHARLRAVLDRARGAASMAVVGEAIRDDVQEFVAGAEVADDLALLILRWNGA
jgi:adenylate cyclase